MLGQKTTLEHISESSLAFTRFTGAKKSRKLLN